jgi:hypothetical protein
MALGDEIDEIVRPARSGVQAANDAERTGSVDERADPRLHVLPFERENHEIVPEVNRMPREAEIHRVERRPHVDELGARSCLPPRSLRVTTSRSTDPLSGFLNLSAPRVGLGWRRTPRTLPPPRPPEQVRRGTRRRNTIAAMV